MDSGLERIVIPEGILKIKGRAFSWCQYLSDLVLPKSLTSIGTSAFEHCYSLTHITIPDNITSIGAGAFYIDALDQAWVPGYGLTSVSFGKGVESIGAMAFRGHYDLRKVTIPASTTYIGLDAFGIGTAFFDGPAPEVQSVPDEWWDFPEPLAYHIHVWPRHLESFEEEHPVLGQSKIIIRDTSPKISSLIVEEETITISITGAPGTAYLCKTSADLAEFRVSATDPGTLMLDSTGKMEFSVQANLAGSFFVIEESP